MSEMEQDFNKVAEQINEKIKEAAASLREANELATKLGLPSLIYTQFSRDEMQWQNRHREVPMEPQELEEKLEELQGKLEFIDVGPLEAALGDGGWSTSSSYC